MLSNTAMRVVDRIINAPSSRAGAPNFPPQPRAVKCPTARVTFQAVDKYAEKMANRLAEIHVEILDAIDEAITKFRTDLKATKSVRQPDGSITEEPVMRLTPKDVAILIDRFQALFERPSVISQHQGLTVTLELSVDALTRFVEATGGVDGPPSLVSPIPRSPRRQDD